MATQSTVYVWNYRDSSDDAGVLAALPGMEGIAQGGKAEQEDNVMEQ